MKKELENFFIDNYDKRFYYLLVLQVILLLIYRIFILLTTTQSITGITFFTPDQIVLGFSIVEILLVGLFIIKIPSSFQKQDIFTVILAINVFFMVLYVEQNLISNNPLIFQPDDLIFVIIQFLGILVLYIIFRYEIRFDFQSKKQIILLLPIFLMVLFAKISNSAYNLTNIFLILALIIFWIMLWIYIVQFTKMLYEKHKWKAFIPILIAVFLVMGMYMGMTKSLGGELAKTVFNTINDQAFSMYSTTTLLFGFNPEILMIVINLLSGFTFLIVVITLILFEKEKRKDVIPIIIIINTGLSVLPLIATMRFLALFKYLKIKDKN